MGLKFSDFTAKSRTIFCRGCLFLKLLLVCYVSDILYIRLLVVVVELRPLDWWFLCQPRAMKPQGCLKTSSVPTKCRQLVRTTYLFLPLGSSKSRRELLYNTVKIAEIRQHRCTCSVNVNVVNLQFNRETFFATIAKTLRETTSPHTENSTE